MKRLRSRTLFVCSLVVAAALACWQARAVAHDHLKWLGEGAATLSALTPGATLLAVNGAVLEIESHRSELSPAQTLVLEQQRCREWAGSSELGAFSTSLRIDRRQALLACVDPKGAIDVAEWIERARSAAESGDPTLLGELRATWVLEEGRGARAVTVRTRSPLPIPTMFPEHGDAPGNDPRDVPRPKGSRRVLSASSPAPAAPAQLAGYSVVGDPRAALARYAGELRAQGFRLEQLPQEAEPGVLAARGRELVLVHAAADGEHNSVLVLLPVTPEHATLARKSR